jgi:hypothetical protein
MPLFHGAKFCIVAQNILLQDFEFCEKNPFKK